MLLALSSRTGAGLLGAPLSQLGPGGHGRADATGANSVTNAVPIGSTPPMPMPADSKNDPKPGKKTGTADAPCFQRVVSLFSLCYLLLEKSSKSLIPLSDCPFVLNRLPVFLKNLPVSGKKQGNMSVLRNLAIDCRPPPTLPNMIQPPTVSAAEFGDRCR
jgi:hypothetical protein